jgi:DNA-directed RNA polymerase subunit M/transcription elongation factor TFIIS
MQFCSECHNMYYLKIQDENGTISDTLIYYCRNCGHEDTTLSTTNICVSDIQLRTSEKKYTHIVNEYTKYDPTLPRINTIKCPNQECASNHYGGGAGKKTAKGEGTEDTAKTATDAKTAEAAKTVRKKLTIKKTAKNDLAEQAQAEQAQAEQAQAEHMEQTQAEQAQAEQMEQTQQAEHMEQTQQPGDVSTAENNREVIYIRYDDTNMKYVYLCVHCDTTWRTDNRI